MVWLCRIWKFNFKIFRSLITKGPNFNSLGSNYDNILIVKNLSSEILYLIICNVCLEFHSLIQCAQNFDSSVQGLNVQNFESSWSSEYVVKPW